MLMILGFLTKSWVVAWLVSFCPAFAITALVISRKSGGWAAVGGIVSGILTGLAGGFVVFAIVDLVPGVLWPVALSGGDVIGWMGSFLLWAIFFSVIAPFAGAWFASGLKPAM